MKGHPPRGCSSSSESDYPLFSFYFLPVTGQLYLFISPSMFFLAYGHEAALPSDTFGWFIGIPPVYFSIGSMGMNRFLIFENIACVWSNNLNIKRE